MIFGIKQLTNYGKRHAKLFTNCHVSWDTLYGCLWTKTNDLTPLQGRLWPRFSPVPIQTFLHLRQISKHPNVQCSRFKLSLKNSWFALNKFLQPNYHVFSSAMLCLHRSIFFIFISFNYKWFSCFHFSPYPLPTHSFVVRLSFFLNVHISSWF